MTQTIQDDIKLINPNKWQSGIYKITASTGHYIVGSTNNFKNRWNVHQNSLKRNKHCNIWLQRLYNINCTGWCIEAIEQVTELNELLKTEQKYINQHYDNPLCVNISKDALAPMKGRNHTLKTRLKISMNSARKNKPGTMLNRTHSEETKQKMSLTHRKNDIKDSDKTREKKRVAKIGNNWNKGRKHTQEFKDKIKASWILRKAKKQINTLNMSNSQHK